MADDKHPTRDLLLEAGIRLVSTKPLAEISVSDIVQEAGVAKGTFYVHFPDRAAYLIAQHARFYATLGTHIQKALRDLPRGAERLQRAAITYLDGCLGEKAAKAMLLEARTLPEIEKQVHETAVAFSKATADDFKALKATHPEASARLFIAMVDEIAVIESGLGKADKKLRSALFSLAGLAR